MTTPVSETDKVNLSKYIDNTLMSGRPHIRGRRMPVWLVAASFESGMSLADIAFNYTITEAQILAALLYYREHKDEIDAQTEEDKRIFEEMREKQDESWKQRWDNRK
jgi:uncharacterized protein (DUF433 family)